MPLSKKTTLTQLAKQAQEGNEDAFTGLYEATYQQVYYYTLSLVRHKDDASDLLQEIYIQVYKDIGSLRECSLVQAWIYRIAYHTCMRFLKRERAKVPSLDIDDESAAEIAQSDPETDPLLRAIKSERQARVISSLETLSPNSKTVLLLRYFNDMKLSEISSVLGCPVGTVKSRLDLAKRQMKKAFEKQNGKFRMYMMFLPLTGALAASAKGAALSADAALTCLTGALGEAGLSTAVSFTPVPFARPVGSAAA
ncbi:MAG: RNA polymerase sigma factor, partial [Oscillospiraceae bacterium]|nr:RNA polymerase sigma factor [Oscillospiraceae bacterium]